MSSNKENQERLRLYLGTGCGKTTATFGLILRAISRGKNAALVFFDKLETNSSEGKALRFLSQAKDEGFGKLVINYTGINRIGNGPGGSFRLYSCPNGILPEDKTEAQAGLGHLRAALTNKTDLVIADEVLDVARVGLISWEDLKDILHIRQDPTIVVLTGRRAPEWLMDEATTISEITPVKHHGRAITGIDC